MWPYLFLGTSLSTIVFVLLWRNETKKRRSAEATADEFDAKIKEIETARQDERDRSARLSRATAQHVQSFRDQIKGEIKEAARLGSDDSVLRMVNAGLERMRKLSETNSVDEDAELRRRHRAATVDNRTSGD